MVSSLPTRRLGSLRAACRNACARHCSRCKTIMRQGQPMRQPCHLRALNSRGKLNSRANQPIAHPLPQATCAPHIRHLREERRDVNSLSSNLYPSGEIALSDRAGTKYSFMPTLSVAFSSSRASRTLGGFLAAPHWAVLPLALNLTSSGTPTIRGPDGGRARHSGGQRRL